MTATKSKDVGAWDVCVEDSQRGKDCSPMLPKAGAIGQLSFADGARWIMVTVSRSTRNLQAGNLYVEIADDLAVVAADLDLRRCFSVDIKGSTVRRLRIVETGNFLTGEDVIRCDQ